MYWGKPLNQCDPKACFGIQFSLFNSKKQSNRINNNSGLQNTSSPRNQLGQKNSGSQLRQKRSLKKCMSPSRSPQNNSLKTSTTNSFYQSQYRSPSKISLHKSEDRQVFLERQSLINIEKKLKNLQTVQTQITAKSTDKNCSLYDFGSNSSRMGENCKNSHRNQQMNEIRRNTPQQNYNFVKKQASHVFYHNHIELKTTKSPRVNFNSPIKFTYQSPSKNFNPIIQAPIGIAFENFQSQIVQSPRKNIELKKQLSKLYCQQSINPKKSLEHICKKRQTVSQEFPTIREENQTIQQSRSQIQSKQQIIQLFQRQNDQKAQQEKARQKQLLLKEINQVLFNNESEKQSISLNSQGILLSPRSQQTSVIEENANIHNMDISCDQLISFTQNKISEQSPKIEESFVENVGEKQYSLSPSEKYYYERRPSHLPSIAIKLIENKLRSHNYQISELCNSSKNIASSRHFSNQQGQEDFEQKSKNNNQTESMWKKLYQQNSQAFTLSNQSNSIPLKFKLQECKSQWISDSKIVQNRNLQSLQSSFIELLTEQKQNGKQLKNQKICKFVPHNVIQTNIFKDSTNVQTVHSDRQRSSRKSTDKKIKTLINHKVTFHSILEEEYSSSEIAKTSGHHQSKDMSFHKNILQNHINEFQSIHISKQNVDRDQSTVIGKYTFQTMQHRVQ